MAAACDATRKHYQMPIRLHRRPSKVREVLLEQEENVILDKARGLYLSEEQFRELFNHPAHPNIPCSHSSNLPL